jgi:steroid delta-isomerase-like uncharacterized protein
MSNQENEKLVRDYMQEHDPRFLAPDAVMVDFTQPEQIRGQEAISRMLEMLYRTAFPGAHAEIQHVLAGDSSVSVEFIFHGVNDGNLMGIPATHREVRVPMCVVYDVQDGLIRQLRMYYDSALLTRQLGLGLASSAR